jgi:hypothetical protein
LIGKIETDGNKQTQDYSKEIQPINNNNQPVNNNNINIYIMMEQKEKIENQMKHQNQKPKQL